MSGEYQTVVLAKRPGYGPIVPGQTFALKSATRVTESQLKEGQLEVQVQYLSLDPAMRGWLDDVRSYVPPVPVGGVMRGAAVAKIVKSKNAKYPVGRYVYAQPGWTEYAVLHDKSLELELLDVPEGGRITDALGVLGLTGLTAYFGILDVGQIKKGDFVVVSGAAGATGSVVCQIAKLKGCTVLGLAGSADKVQWLKDLGCDDALNYKDADFYKKFRAATPKLIDVFFDNVGGDILDAALSRAKPHARFVICGAISQYNSSNPVGPKKFAMVISMRIKCQGFIVFDYAKQYPQARRELAQWLAEGKIQRQEYIVKGGLKNAEQGLFDLFAGKNTGKILVEVAGGEKGSAKL